MHVRDAGATVAVIRAMGQALHGDKKEAMQELRRKFPGFVVCLKVDDYGIKVNLGTKSRNVICWDSTWWFSEAVLVAHLGALERKATTPIP